MTYNPPPRLSDEQLARVLLIVVALRRVVGNVTDKQLDMMIDALDEELPIDALEAIVCEVAERRAEARAAEKDVN